MATNAQSKVAMDNKDMSSKEPAGVKKTRRAILRKETTVSLRTTKDTTTRRLVVRVSQASKESKQRQPLRAYPLNPTTAAVTKQPAMKPRVPRSIPTTKTVKEHTVKPRVPRSITTSTSGTTITAKEPRMKPRVPRSISNSSTTGATASAAAQPAKKQGGPRSIPARAAPTTIRTKSSSTATTQAIDRNSASVKTKPSLPDVVAPSLDLVTPEKPDMFWDPDAGRDDPQDCAEYVKDIYNYWLVTERKELYVIEEDFLVPMRFVKSSHRSILVDWLFEVQPRFKLLNETMFLCVDILDRFLQVEPLLPKSKLQLIGVTALFIASKYEEIYPPSITDLIYITADSYTKEQVLAKEVDILKKLSYEFNRPYSLAFLRRYSAVMATTTGTHNLAKYLLELSLLDHRCSSLLPSKRAAAALLLSSSIIQQTRPPVKLWSENMAYHTKYQVRDIHDAKLKLKQAVQEGHNSPKTTAIKRKYRRNVLGNPITLSALNRL